MTTENKSSRTLVNLIGVPSLLAIIVVGDSFQNLPLFSIFIGVVLYLGALEIKILVKDKGATPLLPVLILFLALLQINRHPGITWDVPLEMLLLSLALVTMIIETFRKAEKPLMNISTVIFAFIWIGVMLGSLSIIRNFDMIGFRLTFALFLSVWICDTAAFVFGKKWGKAKILSEVSPNKTWVGTIAGFTGSIFFLLILHQIDFFYGVFSFGDIIVFGIITGGFGQLGDFAESLLKREAGVKDTSNFLRGHGGILDRFDSLTFAAPLTYLYCHYILKIG